MRTAWLLNTPVCLLLVCAPSAEAQADSPPKALITMLDAACTWDDSYAQDTTLANVIGVNAVGTVLRQFDSIPDEGAHVDVIVVGPTERLNRILARRSSPTNDTDIKRLDGTSTELLTSGQETKCGGQLFRLEHFAAPEGRVELVLVTGEALPTKVGEVTFPVRRRYTGAVSFGPFYTTLGNPEFVSVPADFGEPASDSVLAVAEASGNILHTLSLTYFPGGTTSASWSDFGFFLGLPIEDFHENLVGGLALKLARGIAQIHGGVHVGKVRHALGGLEDGAVTNGLDEVPVGEQWKMGVVFGLTVDAQAAASAFGKAVGGLGGS